MTDNFLDRSNYFKGLLLLIGKDSKITKSEKALLNKVRDTLDFEKQFFEDSLNDFFENEYISHDPPKFSQKIYAEAFIRDGLRLAVADNDLHKDEYEFLLSVVELNELDDEWFQSEIEIATTGNYYFDLEKLEIEKFFSQKAVNS